jgi:hypothetical protein
MSIDGGPDIIKDGLVFCLDAGNRNSYNSGSNTWFDLSGNNSGSLINGPTYNTGNNGSIVFDGSNDYIQCPALNLTYISICAWVKANASTKGYIVNRTWSGAVLGTPYSLNVKGNNDAAQLDGIAFHANYAWKNSGMNTDIRGDGKWHYVVGTFNGTNLSLYLDGVLDATSTEGSGYSLPSTSVNLDIGRHANDGHYFGGNISQVSIYNRALSLIEIQQNYHTNKGRFGL